MEYARRVNDSFNAGSYNARRSHGVRARRTGRLLGDTANLGELIRRYFVLLLMLAASGAVASETPRVVLLSGTDPIQPAALVQIRAVRGILDDFSSQRAEVFLDSIDGFRFDNEDLTAEFLALMRKKYARQHIDLVIAIGDRAASFALKHGADIWPGASVLISSVPSEWLRTVQLPRGYAVVPFQIDIDGTLRIIERLQPHAHHLVVVGGVAQYDLMLTDRAVKAARERTGRWTQVERWDGLPPAELERRLATLDNDTAVLYTTTYRDRDGQRYFPSQLIAPMAQASHAPIYGWYSTYVERGATGGAVYDFAENGRATGMAAVEILRRGGNVDGLTFPELKARCTVSATQLERFGLSADRLPSGCELTDLPPSIYREYRGTVLTALAVLVAQLLTIIALLAQRRQRRLAQAEALARRGELARAARFATVGELSASIAHEVGQPLSAILSNADAADLIIKSKRLDIDELREILADVRRDALRANDVIRRLRALLQKQSLETSVVRLDETLQQSLSLIEPEARRRGIRVESRFAGGDGEVIGDSVQLQQVLLNLAINAMDAMEEVALARRVLSISTQPVASGIELAIEDRGCGFSSDSGQRLFEPFYTTKPHGMGLGLTIVRSIVEAHRGRVTATLREGGGTRFAVWLPVVQGRAASAHAGVGAAQSVAASVQSTADAASQRTVS